MAKFFVIAALLIVAAYAAPSPPTPPTAEEIKAEMVAAGVSESAASGIIEIGEKYKDQLESAKEDRDAAKTVMESIKSDVDKYMDTQSESDQSAYKTYSEKKMADMKAHMGSTPSH